MPLKTASRKILRTLIQSIDPGGNGRRWYREIAALPAFRKSLAEYSRLPNAEPLAKADQQPKLLDKTSHTPFDAHYVYQGYWAMQQIKATGVGHHVDIGSQVNFVVALTTIARVTFIDIRPLVITATGFYSLAGSLLELPFPDVSIPSLSCLHVAEHVGLGRYGDPLDPQGTQKACRELTRVLAANGHLYFSLPVGKPRVCFNAHRIHAPQQILEYFQPLTLLEFAAVDDHGRFLPNTDPHPFGAATYACGMFHFTKSK